MQTKATLSARVVTWLKANLQRQSVLLGILGRRGAGSEDDWLVHRNGLISDRCEVYRQHNHIRDLIYGTSPVC